MFYVASSNIILVLHILAQQAAAAAISQRAVAATAVASSRNGGPGGNGGAMIRGISGNSGVMLPTRQQRADDFTGPTYTDCSRSTITTGGTTSVSTLSTAKQKSGGTNVQALQPTHGLSANQALCCPMCNNAFQNPCLLSCYHTFCAGCIRGAINKDGKLTCPICK